jgi:hypothetical protein
MRHVLAAVLCIAMPIAIFASEKDNGYKVTYDGGSLPDTKAGIGMKIYIESNQVRLAKRTRSRCEGLHFLGMTFFGDHHHEAPS